VALSLSRSFISSRKGFVTQQEAYMARLLMIISSAGCIDLASEKGRETGYSADEVLKPYDKFLAAGVEMVAATPDGKPPHADPFTLEPRFHYPDEDKDFLSQVMRSFAPDLNDIRVTLHHLTELDLIAARRVSQALTASGLDHDTTWSLVTRVAQTAWREDRNFIEVLADDPEVMDKLSPEHLQALAQQVRNESVAHAAYKAERLAAIETLQHPGNLSQMSDEEILSFDAVFLPGGHGAMVDLPSNTDVGRAVRLLHLREKTVATVCHGPAAFLSAGSGPDGAWLFDGYKVVSVTDEEEDQIPYGKLGMPWSLESELKNYGAVFDDGDAAWVSHVVVDRNLVTGQNPDSSEAMAEAILKKLRVGVPMHRGVNE
jgi:putative intracellular protease/amidase